MTLSALATVVKDAKTAVTVIGAAIAAANEILPLVPTQWQHWVTAGIAVATVVVRDLTEAIAVEADLTK